MTRMALGAMAMGAAGIVLLAAGCHAPRNDALWTWTAATDPRVGVMGRVERTADGDLRFGYPGVTLRLAFEGSALALDVACSTADCRLGVWIDGAPASEPALSTGTKRVVLAENLAEGRHSAEIVHLNETWQGVVAVRAVGVRGGRLGEPPPWPARRLLFVGDSVTCGEAVDRIPGTEKSPRWWNAHQSYGMIAARALGAQVQLVCFGGRGLVRDWRGRRDVLNAPQLFELAIPDEASPRPWDARAYTPDAIVVSLGTNDFNLALGELPDREEFVFTYVRFVRAIRGHHPQAQIVLTEGAMVNDDTDPRRPQKTVLREYIAETARRLADERVHLALATHYPGDVQDPHPTREQHAAMARDITSALRAATGWR